MSLAAEVPLDDAIWCLQRLEETEDPIEFRVSWVACVALLRAVGHVLDKVDASNNAELRVAVDGAWSSWKSDELNNAIFWHFIEAERNAILKRYEFGYDDGPMPLIGGADAKDAEVVWLDDGLYVPSLSDDFPGEDARDLAQQAVDWWRRQLAAIESAASPL